MKLIYIFITVFLIVVASSCSSKNILTEEERIIQNKADSEVATLLFDRELTNLASYRVHKNGFVVISFDKTINIKDYTAVVKQLRSNKSIFGVRAEQQGKEICPLK